MFGLLVWKFFSNPEWNRPISSPSLQSVSASQTTSWRSFAFMTKQVSFDFGLLMFAWIISPSLIAAPKSVWAIFVTSLLRCRCSATLFSSSSRGVVAAPLLQRMPPGLHGECGPAILPHERRGPENSLPVPQIRALFLRLPAVRRKDGGQDPWRGCSLSLPNPPPSALGRQSHVPRHPPP